MAQRRTKTVSEGVLGGDPRLDGHRISVRQIYEAVEEGDRSPGTVADRYDLDVAAVYRALASSHEYPGAMAAVRERRTRRIEAAQADAPTPAEQVE